VDVEAYLGACAGRVEGVLEKVLPGVDEAPRDLHRAMRHLVFPGGKRIRPALAIAGAEAAGCPSEAALPMAAAVELVHTYSLIHDDLPCMDDDAERRGRPTVHVVYGEAVAVLAGDALLALAFELLAGGDGAPERRMAAVGELARAAGSRNLVGGQADDLSLAESEATEAAVSSIHRRKTAALMAAASAGGALLAGADGDDVACLRSFGEKVGLAFQIADDLLDDGRDEPASMVRLLGREEAARRSESLLAAAVAELARFGGRAAPLRELARFAARRAR